MSAHVPVDAHARIADVGPVPHFEGAVGVVRHAADAGTTILTVRFGDGARTEWHRHDRGQYLESLAGRGWVCEAGAEPIELRPGDRVWCPPGTVHRHGAAPGEDWVQFSITPGGTAWQEAPDSAEAAGNTQERSEECRSGRS